MFRFFSFGGGQDAEAEINGSSRILGAPLKTYAISMRCGSRPYMEDCCCAEDLEGKDAQDVWSFFGVFDGHGGAEAAEYASKNLPGEIRKQLKERDFDEGKVSEAITKAFEIIDAAFCDIARSRRLMDGSTATTALMHNNKLWVANAGDSRTVMVRESGPEDMSEDHKPDLPSERARIEAQGGQVLLIGVWRVNGILATSRGFGDVELKPPVTCEPEIREYTLQDGDLGLVLASDGLWDTCSGKDCAEAFASASSTLQIAQDLSIKAIQEGSMDNIGVVAVRFTAEDGVVHANPQSAAALSNVANSVSDNAEALARLAQVNSTFRQLCSDEALWRRLCFQDYSIDVVIQHLHAYDYSWRLVYANMRGNMVPQKHHEDKKGSDGKIATNDGKHEQDGSKSHGKLQKFSNSASTDIKQHTEVKSEHLEELPFGRRRLVPAFKPLKFDSHFWYAKWCRQHMDLSNFVVNKQTARLVFETDSWLDESEFFAKFESPGLPVLLKQACIGWRSFRFCSSVHPEKALPLWLMQYPTVRFRVSHGMPGVGKLAITALDYAKYVCGQQDEQPLYVFDADFGSKDPRLVKEYAVPNVFVEDAFACLGCHRPDYRWIVAGPQRCGAPWHVDPVGTSAWNGLATGRKRWALYPSDRQSPPPGVEATWDELSGTWSNVSTPTSLVWYLEIYPYLTEEEKPIEVVQEAGDVIFVPGGWWHLVLNLDDTLAFTQNFVSPVNAARVADELLADDPKFFSVVSTIMREKEFQTWDKFEQSQLVKSLEKSFVQSWDAICNESAKCDAVQVVDSCDTQKVLSSSYGDPAFSANIPVCMPPNQIILQLKALQIPFNDVESSSSCHKCPMIVAQPLTAAASLKSQILQNWVQDNLTAWTELCSCLCDELGIDTACNQFSTFELQKKCENVVFKNKDVVIKFYTHPHGFGIHPAVKEFQSWTALQSTRNSLNLQNSMDFALSIPKLTVSKIRPNTRLLPKDWHPLLGVSDEGENGASISKVGAVAQKEEEDTRGFDSKFFRVICSVSPCLPGNTLKQLQKEIVCLQEIPTVQREQPQVKNEVFSRNSNEQTSLRSLSLQDMKTVTRCIAKRMCELHSAYPATLGISFNSDDTMEKNPLHQWTRWIHSRVQSAKLYLSDTFGWSFSAIQDVEENLFTKERIAKITSSAVHLVWIHGDLSSNNILVERREQPCDTTHLNDLNQRRECHGLELGKKSFAGLKRNRSIVASNDQYSDYEGMKVQLIDFGDCMFAPPIIDAIAAVAGPLQCNSELAEIFGSTVAGMVPNKLTSQLAVSKAERSTATSRTDATDRFSWDTKDVLALVVLHPIGNGVINAIQNVESDSARWTDIDALAQAIDQIMEPFYIHFS